MDSFIVLSSILLILIIFFTFNNRRPRLHLPPGRFAWPVIGNLHQVEPVQHKGFGDLSMIYGPIVSVWFGSSLTVVVSSASLAKEVLKDKDHLFANRPRTVRTKASTKDGSDLIWSDYGRQYVKLKKVTVHELFSPNNILRSSSVREEEMTTMVELISRWCHHERRKFGKSLELRRYLKMASFNCMTRIVLGKRFIDDEGVANEEGLELDAIIRESAMLNSSIALMDCVPWLGGIGWMIGKKRFLRCQDRKTGFTRRMLAECEARAKEGDGASKEYFLGALVSLREAHDLSEDNILGLVWDMITASLDTAAVAVEWAMAHLMKSPSMLAEAQDELERVTGPDKAMTELDFPKLQYLRCVVKETLRLHPSTPLMLPHKAKVETKIGGYDVPKGASVAVNVWAIARDPAVWKDPHAFQPERFLSVDIDMTGRDFRFLPFGSGRRMCPGAQLGINLVMLMLGRLLHHFSWRVEEGQEIDMSEGTGLVCSMRSPLQAVPTPRRPTRLYN
uniref:Cytochrome P450 n=1 Tax=Kalanchoe fedtschenkoi TaxID=63787 RepID=A0A7N0V178_KALFE